ncbi:MAG: DUF559 domain-containing protein [Ignavibacteria bacterium]|nr:DUF559 domain-containing protein [Ignavibacteria bacterium]
MTKHYNKTELKNRRRQLRSEQTFCEKIVWNYLKGRKLSGKKFRRQYSIDNYIVDFYCPELKIAVEIDGDVHNLPEQKEYDIERQKYLENYGVAFVRLKNEEALVNGDKAFARIGELIDELKHSSQPGKL